MKRRAIVIDESLTVRMDICEALQAEGFDTLACVDVQDARGALARGAFVLIVASERAGLSLVESYRSAELPGQSPLLLLCDAADVARYPGASDLPIECVGRSYNLALIIERARAVMKPSAPVVAASVRHVLVIDDSVTYRNQLKDVLEDAGYRVSEAETGEEGLVRVTELQPDALIVDGLLPGIDGATVVRRLKSDTALRSMPCLLLTAAEGAQDELRSLEAGADAYVRKSEDLDVILARLAALLRHARASGSEMAPGMLGAKRLLAVDDSTTYLHELADQLRLEGHEVLVASSGEEALEILSRESVDCILLDLVMPGLSGQETCRKIKQTPALRDIPLVMLTGRDDRDAMIEGINAGADDYISKAADFDVLKARLGAQLRRKHFETENRRIREKLVRREAEARFQRLIHSNIIGIIFGDLDGHLTDANDAFLSMLGFTRTELEAGELRWDVLTHPEWRPRYVAAVDELRRTGSVASFETELLCKDGHRLPIVQGLVLLGGSDATVGFVLDRTEQRNAEEEIRRYTLALEQANRDLASAKELAEQSSRFKSSFLANMSHELRTPLNAIIGFAELLYDGQVRPDMPEHQEFLGDILKSGRHLLQLINDVLDLSKVEAGKMEFHPEPVAVGDLVREVLAVLRTAASEKRILIETQLSADLGTLVIDPGRLKQVLYNYVSNALKFTPDGGRITIRVAPEHGGMFLLEVEDTGVGISPENLARLFAEFEQLDASAAKKHAGTGLGLALTKRLVEAQGGSVGARSTLGSGSTFHVVLPQVCAGNGRPSSPLVRPMAAGIAPVHHHVGNRHHAEPPVAVKEERTLPVRHASVPPPQRTLGAPQRSGTLLIVEDDPGSSKLMTATLAQLGYRAICASGAREGLRIAEYAPPHAVVLDLLMPDMDGFAFLELFRRLPRCEAVPVIVWSSKDLTQDEYARLGPLVQAVFQKGRDLGTALVDEICAALSPTAPGSEG